MIMFMLIFLLFCSPTISRVFETPNECEYVRIVTVNYGGNINEDSGVTIETSRIELDTRTMYQNGYVDENCGGMYIFESTEDAPLFPPEFTRPNITVDLNGTEIEPVNNNSTNSSNITIPNPSFPFYSENGCNSAKSLIYLEVEFLYNEDGVYEKEFYMYYGCSYSNVSNNQIENTVRFISMSTQGCANTSSEVFTEMNNRFLRSSGFMEVRDSRAHLHPVSSFSTARDSGFGCVKQVNEQDDVVDDGHRHQVNAFVTANRNPTPRYFTIPFCQRPYPTIHQHDINLYEYSDGAGTMLDGYVDIPNIVDRLIRGGSNYGNRGGSDYHNHQIDADLVLSWQYPTCWRSWGSDLWFLTDWHSHGYTNKNQYSNDATNIPPYYSFQFGENEDAGNDLLWQEENDILYLADSFPPYGFFPHFNGIGRFARASIGTSGETGGSFLHNHWIDVESDQATNGSPRQSCWDGNDAGQSYTDHRHRIQRWSEDAYYDLAFVGLYFLKRDNTISTSTEIGSEYLVSIAKDFVDDTPEDTPGAAAEIPLLYIIIGIAGGVVALVALIIISICIIALCTVCCVVLRKKKSSAQMQAMTEMMVESSEKEVELMEEKRKLEEEREFIKEEREKDEQEKEQLKIELERLKNAANVSVEGTGVKKQLAIIDLNDLSIGKMVKLDKPKCFEVYRGKLKTKDQGAVGILIKQFNDDVFKRGTINPLEVLKSFVQEYMVIDHPNILKYRGISYNPKDNTSVRVISDDCLNVSLKCIVSNKRMKFSQKIRLIYELILGLSYLHKRGICHKNLCHETVYITDDYKPKIDMGFSKFLNVDFENSEYAAPELVVGTGAPPQDDDVDEDDEDDVIDKWEVKCDIYSFGVIMFNVLTQNFDPYKLQGRIVSVGLKAANDPNFRPVSVSLSKNVMKRYPNWWVNLMKQCTAPSPDDRPNCESIITVIMNVLDQDKSMFD